MKNRSLYTYFFVVLLFEACGQTTDKGINLPVTNSFTEVLVVDNLQNPWGMAFYLMDQFNI